MDNKIDRSRNGDQCFIGSRSRNETLSDDVAQDAVVRPKEYRSPFNAESRVGRMTGRPLYTSRDATQGKKQVNQVKASSRAKSQHFSKKWDLNREYLEQLTRQSPEQIGIRFINNREDFIKLMKHCRNDSALIDILLNIFAKIALPESQHFLSLLNAINESQFLENKAVPYILSLIGMGRQNIETVRNIVRILSAMADTSVNSVVSFYSALTALSVLIDEIQTSKLCSEAMREEFEEFGRLKSRIQSVRRTNEKRRRNAEDRLLPPDNFRSVSIIPTEKDLLPGGAPFLRKNKAYGTFNNLDHYLDVQFRLLREDYIAPLRESIQEYRNSLSEIKRGKRRIKDIRLYTNVRIAGTTLNTDGIGHILTFESSGTKRVNWEYSKRLNFGALLALSHDNFTTVHFATITSRKVEDLDMGIIEVQFIGKADDIAQMADKVFVLAESDEYFEAYKHNLIVLQNITFLPFSKYIIECKEETDAPTYLKKDEDMTYDLSLMARDDAKFYFEDSGDIYTMSRKEDMPDTQDSLDESNTPNNIMKYNPASRISSVLKDEEWPSASELGLDDTQFRAVRNALTKEFSITQGPPGTGKTYVGLKIAKALLANRRLWDNNENRRPLLVVCYTNHALDQFLCGIHDFFQGKIVRVGGRSTNEVMRQHGVSTMYRHISYDILETSSALRNTMNLFDKQIMQVKKQLCRIDTKLLGEIQIEKYAGELHESLMSGFHLKIFYINTLRATGKRLDGYHFNVVAEWLGCGTLFKKTRFQVSFPTVGEKLKCIQSGIKDFGNNSDTVLTQDNICLNEFLRHISKDDIKQLANNCDEPQKPKKQKGSVDFSTITPASEKEQRNIKDAWKLPIRLRWRLYKRWSEQFKIDLNALLTINN